MFIIAPIEIIEPSSFDKQRNIKTETYVFQVFENKEEAINEANSRSMKYNKEFAVFELLGKSNIIRKTEFKQLE